MKQPTCIGQVLLRMGKVTAGALDGASAMTPDRPLRFASRLWALYGIDEGDLVSGLAAQRGCPGIILSRTCLDLSTLGTIPREVAMQSLFLPVALEEGRLLVAMADPDDQTLLDKIAFVTGLPITPFLALQGVLDEAIDQSYQALSEGVRFFSPLTGECNNSSLKRVHPAGTLPVSEGLMTDEDEEVFSVTVEIDEDEDDSGFDSYDNEIYNEYDPNEEEGSELSVEESNMEEHNSRRILVVDDEPDVLRLLGIAFRRAGYTVETASAGLEALEKIRSFNPDLVVLDAMLPEVHGFEICRKIRSSRRFAHLPVIMITAVYRGWRFAQDIKESYGANDYIEKPFRIGDVLKRVAQVLDGEDTKPVTSEEARDRALILYRKGVDLLKKENINAALESFREGIKEDPCSSTLHFCLGHTLYQKKEIYRAITAYEQSIELNPSFFPALKNLALLYEREGFLRKSIEIWEQALPNAPNEDSRQLARERLLKLVEEGRSALMRSVEIE